MASESVLWRRAGCVKVAGKNDVIYVSYYQLDLGGTMAFLGMDFASYCFFLDDVIFWFNF